MKREADIDFGFTGPMPDGSASYIIFSPKAVMLSFIFVFSETVRKA
ncbi:MAG: hypothetical protein HGB22_04005 [Chlorobiaceae bacterium]|nr:hypothetical protein [Chlorobiaceae bacterium]